MWRWLIVGALFLLGTAKVSGQGEPTPIPIVVTVILVPATATPTPTPSETPTPSITPTATATPTATPIRSFEVTLEAEDGQVYAGTVDLQMNAGEGINNALLFGVLLTNLLLFFAVMWRGRK